MAPSKSPISSAAAPKYGNHLDVWNSSATGHQTAENRLSSSTGWRQSRSVKLSNQLRSGATGGKRISDLVGAGSENWDDKTKALIPKVARARARVSEADMLLSKRPRMLCVILTRSLKPDFWCSYYYVAEHNLWRPNEAASGYNREEDK
jgi:hypothetical protein